MRRRRICTWTKLTAGQRSLMCGGLPEGRPMKFAAGDIVTIHGDRSKEWMVTDAFDLHGTPEAMIRPIPPDPWGERRWKQSDLKAVAR